MLLLLGDQKRSMWMRIMENKEKKGIMSLFIYEKKKKKKRVCLRRNDFGCSDMYDV